MQTIFLLKICGIITLLLSPSLLGATQNNAITTDNTHTISLNFPDTGKRGAPKRTAGGGTRSDDTTCFTKEDEEPPLVALMPNRDNISKTTMSNPNFYVYLPTTTATEGEFILIDEDNNEIYYTMISLPENPGIIRLQIPKTVSLNKGHQYSWSFMVICDSRYRNRDKYVEGILDYVEIDQQLETQLKQSSSLEKATLYAQAILWHETLDILAQMRTEHPQEWQELLTSVGLEMLIDVPFIQCCEVTN